MRCFLIWFLDCGSVQSHWLDSLFTYLAEFTSSCTFSLDSQHFVHTRSCHQRIKMFLFLSSQPRYISFSFFLIAVIRTSIKMLNRSNKVFLILGGKHLVLHMKHGANYRVLWRYPFSGRGSSFLFPVAEFLFWMGLDYVRHFFSASVARLYGHVLHECCILHCVQMLN